MPVIVLSVTHIVGNKSEKNPGTDILVSRHIVNKEIYNNLGPFLFKDVFREVGNGEVDHAWPHKPYKDSECYCEYDIGQF